jgi:hypothetical protein
MAGAFVCASLGIEGRQFLARPSAANSIVEGKEEAA